MELNIICADCGRDLTADMIDNELAVTPCQCVALSKPALAELDELAKLTIGLNTGGELSPLDLLPVTDPEAYKRLTKGGDVAMK